MDHHEEDEEEGALVILQQRTKLRKAQKNRQALYNELEENLYDVRRPPRLRTAGGEICQGVYPPASKKWLGVAPHFGSKVPEEKYVGWTANGLSQWISADKCARLKSEMTLRDQPVRAYLKIDDSIDVTHMTGSHFRYISNPLLEEEPPQPMLEWDGSGGSGSQEGSYDPAALQNGEEEDGEEWDYEEEEEEEYEEEEESEVSAALVPLGTPRKDQPKSMVELDRIFQRHCKKLSSGIQREITDRFEKVENNWRAGQSTRGATMRFRR